MTRPISIFAFFFLLAAQLQAQTPFKTIETIDINDIKASVLVHGDMWWQPDSGNSKCFFPSGGQTTINFAAAIWMSGYDAGNSLHVAAQTYRQSGNDYWPGPLDASASLDYPTSTAWSKIWKVNGTDVQLFNSISAHTAANTPASILTWPGKGNTYAQGAGGVSLTITTDMAPFIDLNSNGIYEPLQGEYPDFPGEQALWWVFSDNGPTRNFSHGTPLKVEVHAMAYAYKRNTLIDHVIYYDYTLLNRSPDSYHNFRFALWDDIDLGYYLDDYIGFDSSRRLGICYNGTDDDGGSGGHPANAFAHKPPKTGITLVSLPGDATSSYKPAGAFATYASLGIAPNYVTSDTTINNVIRAKINYHDYGINDFQGPGNGPQRDTTPLYCNYVFPGDPTDTTQWSECAKNDLPYDRRFVLSSNDFTLNAGSSAHIVMAQVVSDTGDGGCPSASFAQIRQVSDTAWANYYTPPAPLHRPAPSGTANINTYPNPVRNTLYVEDKLHSMDDATITIYNFIGKPMSAPLAKNGQRCEIDLHLLPPGIYNVVYRNGDTQTRTKFLKE